MERFLANKNLQLDVPITNKNCQNAKYIRNHTKPKGMTHYYDIWHIAKGKNITDFFKMTLPHNINITSWLLSSPIENMPLASLR